MAETGEKKPSEPDSASARPASKLLAEGTEAWLEALRARFIGFARRRLAPDDVDDVVQDALSIVIFKGLQWQERTRVKQLPAVGWCFRVLHHTIGNHYQRERTRARRADYDSAFHRGIALSAANRISLTPLEELEAHEAMDLLRAAIAEMANAPCGRYLTHLLEGSTPADLAREENVKDEIMYRRLYRCRQRLGSILRRMGFAS